LPLFKKATALDHINNKHMLKGLEEFNLFSQGELSEYLQTEVYGKE
jgi:hypothetical protein